MPRVDSMINLIGKLESPWITVHQERCVQVRNRNTNCLRCAEVCTSGCISYTGEALEIDNSLCIGCGTCATVCPTCALEAHHPNDAELINACSKAISASDGQLVIACGSFLDAAQGRYDEDKVVRVECLGRIEESLLTMLVAAGITEIRLVRGACESCEHASGWEMFEQVKETEDLLLNVWNTTANIEVSHKLPAFTRGEEADYDVSKRAAFEEAKDEGAHLGAALAETALEKGLGTEEKEEPSTFEYLKVKDNGALPQFIPDRRERLLDALAELGEPEDVMINTRLWGHVIIDTEACKSCQMCATFCPTGALQKFKDEDGTFGVEHYPGDCVKCRSCEAICPAQCLEISEEVFAREMLEGMTDRYVMKPLKVELDSPHTIWHTMQTYMNTDQVYER